MAKVIFTTSNHKIIDYQDWNQAKKTASKIAMQDNEPVTVTAIIEGKTESYTAKPRSVDD